MLDLNVFNIYSFIYIKCKRKLCTATFGNTYGNDVDEYSTVKLENNDKECKDDTGNDSKCCTCVYEIIQYMHLVIYTCQYYVIYIYVWVSFVCIYA